MSIGIYHSAGLWEQTLYFLNVGCRCLKVGFDNCLLGPLDGLLVLLHVGVELHVIVDKFFLNLVEG